MMKGVLREYGLIALVIVVAIAGVIYYQQNKEDLLSYSLDAIGERLAALVEDTGNRAMISAHFAQFKERVLAHEVTPEQVENITANVLNLSASGSKLTAEQAAMVLAVPFETAEALPVPRRETVTADDLAGLSRIPADSAEQVVAGGASSERPARGPVVAAAPRPDDRAVRPPPPPRVTQAGPPARPIRPQDMEALGKRLDAMVAFEAQVRDVMAARSVSPQELVHRIRFEFKDGLRIAIDAQLAEELDREALKPLARELERMEERKMVIWHENMARQLQGERDRARRQLRALSRLEAHRKEELRGAFSGLEALKNLEALGYTSDLDTEALDELIEEYMEQAEEDLEEQMEAVEEAIEAQMEELEEQLEKLEEHLEEVQEKKNEGEAA